jgi:flagellar hook-associated protein 3 FlgL
VGNAVTRARQLAVQFSSSGYPVSQMGAGAAEVSRMIDEVIARGNTRFGNRWILAGSKDGAPPFDATGGFNGDDALRTVEVAPGVRQEAAINGNAALKGSPGGVDVIATLQALRAALLAGDTTAVQGTLDALDQSVSQVASFRAQAGVAMDAFDTATEAAKVASGDEQTRSDQLGEVDLAQSAIDLSASQRALEASYAAAAQSFRLTMLNYLK